METPTFAGAEFAAEWFYVLVVAWLFVESTGFPISDEPILLAAGYWSSVGELDLALVILLALIGKVGASCLAYSIGRIVPLEQLARPPGRPGGMLARMLYALRPTPLLVARTKGWFRRRGSVAVFLGRLVPVVRSFISYPAGAARMPFLLFLGATTAGSLIWITAWTVLGALLGRSAEEALTRWGVWGRYALGVVVLSLTVAALWAHWRHRRALEHAERPTAGSAGDGAGDSDA